MAETYYKYLVPAYSVAQMNASLQLVRDVEPNAARKIQLSHIMDAISGFIDEYPAYRISEKSVRDASEIMWGQMLANGYKLSAERREILEKNVMKAHPRDSYGIYMAFAAYWRARLDEARGK